MWQRAIDQVREDRTAGHREQRVWKFFQPEPAGARVQPTTPVRTTRKDWLWVVGSTLALAVAVSNIGWLLVQRQSPSSGMAFLVSLVAGYFAAASGADWRFNVEQLRAKEAQHRAPWQRTGHAPAGGFADGVDKLFTRYFAKYAPDEVDRSVWLKKTAGIRRTLRNELVHIYREDDIEPARIAWLIRHLVYDVKRQWLAGTLWAYRYQYRTRFTTKLMFVFCLLALLVGGVWAVAGAVQERPSAGLAWAALALASGSVAGNGWLRIVLERRRFSAESEESARELSQRQKALARWRAKLADKPSDLEMAAWLNCDRKILMDWAMRHYRLNASDVIGHAFVEAPAAPERKRARVRNGPWRYSRYRVLVFLLTLDGVRQAGSYLDFENISFRDWHRTNYRFDAVASVHVTESPGGHPRTFEMKLVNGQSIDVEVPESGAEVLQKGEDSKTLSRVALDSSGLTNTLHILEGIAAEGKEWIKHELQMGRSRITALTEAVHGSPD